MILPSYPFLSSLTLTIVKYATHHSLSNPLIRVRNVPDMPLYLKSTKHLLF